MMRLSVCLLVTVSVTSAAIAQSVIDPSQQTLRQIERDRVIQNLEHSKEGEAIRIGPAGGPVPEAKCFKVHSVKISGVTLLAPWTIAPIQSRYSGKCLGEKSIGALLGEINAAYAQQGFITSRAYVPEQSLRSGALSIMVVEGKIEKIVHRLVDGDGREREAPTLKTGTALPAREQDPFNLRDFEQGLDNINRMSSSKSALDVAPGSNPGGSILVIREHKSDRVRAFIGGDNAGSLSTGSYRARASLEGDDLLYANDQWAVSLITSENSNGLTGSVSLPFGYNEFTLSGSYFESQDILTSTALLFGQTTNVAAKLERLVWRDATTKLRVNGSVQHFWNQRVINSAILTPSERGALRLGVSAEVHAPGSVAQVEIGFSHGVPALFGLDPLPGDRSTTPDLSFTKLDLSMYWIKGFEVGRVITNVQAQLSSDVLLSPDQITIGGWDSVRGYKGSEAAGDRGILARSEFVFAVPSLTVGSDALNPIVDACRKSLEPFVFVDAGTVSSRASREARTMIGAGGGLRITNERFKAELAAGTPLRDVPGLKDDWQIYGSVSVKIY